MKKAILFLFPIQLLIAACNNKPMRCNCDLTDNEINSMSIYNENGPYIIFRNDSTAITDTLRVKEVEKYSPNCSDPCDKNIPGGIVANLTFSKLQNCTVGIWASANTGINVSFPKDIIFGLIKPPISAIVNGTSYNDLIYSSIDSTTIPLSDRVRIPFQIAYSKTIGLVQMKMTNGQTWSRVK